ncbi:MAG: DNA cytosine methyltransferase [Rubrivivax sp.]|nr:DNA cytosine methyltransferase [Rubrivivax sp.]
MGYVLVALPHGSSTPADPNPTHYIVEAERYGVPQARHRVIILGVREDVFARAGKVRRLRPGTPSTVNEVIFDLPVLRPDFRIGARDDLVG